MKTGRKPDVTRRRVLKAGLGATALFLPVPYVWVRAQSEGSMKLLRLPKIALVIGNSLYKNVPSLGNPGNDARAIGEALRQSGFEVTITLDAGREALAAAIRAHVQMLAAKKAVGLFYFAGHGVQLAWRNYLIPVDASVSKLEDIQTACIDLTSLIEGINKASNPMNVVILDACRENPFGGDIRVENRGLSQIDAPHSTLLAYATAPGNVASDGEGANGLYTENLLREMRVPDAKIEDVFKRVRLNVRRRTNGQQIPWESTSLEEDFYFVPPKEIKRISEEEADRLFEYEAALWEKIGESKEPGPLEDYLRRHPGGKFSDLAQLQLDRLLAQQGEKKIEVISDSRNPYTKGSAIADTRFKVGDSYTYRNQDLFAKTENASAADTVTRISRTTVTYDSGLVTDFLGNRIRGRQGERLAMGNQGTPLEFSVGKRWSSRYVMPPGFGASGRAFIDMDFRVVTREPVTVPAGTFNAFHIKGVGFSAGSGANVLRTEVEIWHAPGQVRR
ncbi:MAG: caspase family protein, partial [Burkholderiales bacterium]